MCVEHGLPKEMYLWPGAIHKAKGNVQLANHMEANTPDPQ